jgi:hypothetical protein
MEMQTMKVQELISELSELPADAEVYYMGCDPDFEEPENVRGHFLVGLRSVYRVNDMAFAVNAGRE